MTRDALWRRAALAAVPRCASDELQRRRRSPRATVVPPSPTCDVTGAQYTLSRQWNQINSTIGGGGRVQTSRPGGAALLQDSGDALWQSRPPIPKSLLHPPYSTHGYLHTSTVKCSHSYLHKSIVNGNKTTSSTSFTPRVCEKTLTR